jgi:Fe-S-cluster containining protein
MLQTPEEVKKALRTIKRRAEASKRSTQLFFAKLKRTKPRGFDTVVHKIDAAVFAQTNCLACGNCCKKGTPVFSRGDIRQVSKHLNMDEDAFYDKYLYTDEVGDMIFKKTPCVFLDKQNYCTIYEHRPGDCRKYPHTGTRDVIDKLEMLLDNTFICPAANVIVDQMKEHYRAAWKAK